MSKLFRITLTIWKLIVKLSRRGEYALKAVLDFAACDQLQASSVPEIAQRTQIPEPFLNQIMLTLKNAGLLRSRRGAHGGYVLNRPPEAITLGEVARLMDGPLLLPYLALP